MPLGVVGIIYEARPNVTADAFALCFKTGNAVILRGGSDAINSNRAMVSCIRDGLKKCGIPEDSVQLITDTSRETATGFMRLNGYLDVLINRAMVSCIRDGLKKCGIPEDSVQLITDTSRETATGFMRLNGYLDVLIPRGGAGLIRSVVENSTVPVIETGTGNCHVYVDESADLDMALDIVFNAPEEERG